MTDDRSALPHRRRNPLTGRWVLVSPQRMNRPWDGQQDEADEGETASHDEACYLCPGNERKGGAVNPDYSGTYVFDNDFQAMLDETSGPAADGPLFLSEPVRGRSRVICFSPDHSKTIPQLPLSAIEGVIETWCSQSAELGETFRSVQIFENKGAMMGCSNPHPHGQIWASDHIPDETAVEDANLRDHGGDLLGEVVDAELASGERIVVETGHWVAFVPFWASWPFETLLLPKSRTRRMPELSAQQRSGLAVALKELTARYDNLFRTSFPYSMGWHGAPFDGGDHPHWRLHAHFYPPLLRSATVRKFMVGYEMLAEAQRDLTPERAAEMLRSVSAAHYRDGAA
ncbi:UDP-glucose--hexose-1-phosphate uridylyltransferase [Altererythrobacter sp. ZODW24]|uniref:UDP-glucose--hexose-1-phosphate uridylyltransferase n=1 Tax=Altererythrobacter sp. ZODW24 TaxID=2185142 RepID=UPI000DF72A23|nr:UDP-glucose--hexose-1-phosphate uridylyltransferase [Altererythrobacter sp. ZODW24]